MKAEKGALSGGTGRDLKSMTIEEMTALMKELGFPAFRARQLYRWIHVSLVRDYSEMTNIPKAMAQKLSEEYPLTAVRMIDRQVSKLDGTQKFLFAMGDDSLVESVFMRYKFGNSVCISSQVGCRMGCRFCASTLDGLYRSLTPAEMLDQIYEICDRYRDEKTPLMMILSDIQNEYGYIPLEVQEIVSKNTGISVAEIYGVVTFYSFFSLTPKGKYVIGCCLGTACYVKGAQNVIDKFSELLKIAPGETSEDGLFTLDALRCIGACGIAPAVSINGKVYPKVEVGQVPQIIEDYKAQANA